MKTDLLGSWSLSGQVNTPRRSATTGTVLLRTDAFTEVTIDAELRTARVGAGTRWADVVPRVSEPGLAALHGSTRM